MRSADVRRKFQVATACRAASFRRSGPVTFWIEEEPEASTENWTCTAPLSDDMRARGGATGRRPFVRSGTPGPSATSRTAETPGSGGGAGVGTAAGAPAGGGAGVATAATGAFGVGRGGSGEAAAGAGVVAAGAGVVRGAGDGTAGGLASGVGAASGRRSAVWR